MRTHFYPCCRALCLASFAAVMIAYDASAFSLISSDGPADLQNQPDNFYSYDAGVITWKMTGDFKGEFNNSVLQNQVRAAFSEWQSASTDPTRRTANRYQWTRNNGYQPTADLKSVMIHEIGHAIGFQHADAAWFNEQGNTGSPWNRNYRMQNGSLVAAPPVGGEVMNEGNAPGFLPGAKPPKGIPGGAYWRTVSKDEVAGLDYMYGSPLTFVEVGGNEEAMITVDTFTGSGGSNLGVAGPENSESRPGGGRRILSSTVGLSDNASIDIGVMTRTSNWHFQNNSGVDLEALSIRAEGTSLRNALQTFSNGANRFQAYQPSNAFGLHKFESRGHQFSDPSGGSIPSGQGTNFGMQLDVWDWTVEAVTGRSTEGQIVPMSVVSLMGFEGGGFQAPDPPSEGIVVPGDLTGLASIGVGHDDHSREDRSHEHHSHDGFSTTPGEWVATVHGFRVVASDAPGVLTELGFASVADLGLTGDDLSPDTLRVLDEAGDLNRLDFDPMQLAGGEDLLVVMGGVLDDLPPGRQQSGDFLLMNDPKFAEAMGAGEVLLYARTSGAAGEAWSFSLLGEAPIVGGQVPEPTAAGLLALAVFAGLGHRVRG